MNVQSSDTYSHSCTQKTPLHYLSKETNLCTMLTPLQFVVLWSNPNFGSSMNGGKRGKKRPFSLLNYAQMCKDIFSFGGCIFMVKQLKENLLDG